MREKLGFQVFELGQAERRAEIFAEIDPVLFGDREENLDDLGVELGSGTATDFLACVAHGEGAAVRSIADHGVERVSDGEDAGPKRDGIATQTARVTGAIKEFLVSENDLRRIA